MQKKEQEISKRARVGATPEPHNTYINDVVKGVRHAAAEGRPITGVFTSFATICILFISFYMFTSITMLMQKTNITLENSTRANG